MSGRRRRLAAAERRAAKPPRCTLTLSLVRFSLVATVGLALLGPLVVLAGTSFPTALTACADGLLGGADAGKIFLEKVRFCFRPLDNPRVLARALHTAFFSASRSRESLRRIEFRSSDFALAANRSTRVHRRRAWRRRPGSSVRRLSTRTARWRSRCGRASCTSAPETPTESGRMKAARALYVRPAAVAEVVCTFDP